jgi:hypothetical protein
VRCSETGLLRLAKGLDLSWQKAQLGFVFEGDLGEV